MLYVYAVAIGFGFLTPLVAPLFDAMGNPKLNLKLSLSWTIATLMIVPLTTPRYGTLGFCIGYCIPVVLGNCLVVVVLKRIIPQIRLWPRIRAALVGCVLTATIGVRLLSPWALGPFTLVASIFIDAAAFLVCIWVLDRRSLIDALAILSRKASPTKAA
jgi:O-antigen/teichoic acid export membrane protein